MQVRQQREEHREQHERVHRPDRGAEQPARPVQCCEDEVIDEGEEPSAQQVEDEPGDVRCRALAGEERADEERQAQARVAEALAREEDRAQRRGSDQSPQQPAPDGDGELVRHAVFSTVSAVAAEIMLTCVKACGKLPTGSPVPGTISSAYRPTSFAQRSRRSKISRASSRRPRFARYSAAQNVHGAKAFSLPGTPSYPVPCG